MEEIVNRICAQLPPGWTIALCMSNEGGFWVDLIDPRGRYPSLPDISDKTMLEQLNDALCMAKEKVRA